ncbi:MAG: NTP/NDP exchange transporter [Nitrospinota bacterium]
MADELIDRQKLKPGRWSSLRIALERIVDVRDEEIRALLWSFAYFFCLLCSYYILRPLRDEMGIAGGVKNLQWVFTGTFVAMLLAVPLFGAAAARLPRRRLLPLVYYFFIANLWIFFLLFATETRVPQVARAFFIWVSVFNLFVVSVFWTFMADLFTNEQARRLFGFIAAGGSAGALVGSSLTAGLALLLGPVHLLLISILLLAAAVFCIHRLLRWVDRRERHHAVRWQGAALPAQPEREGHGLEGAGGAPVGGGMWTGVKLVFRSPYLLGICLYIWLYTSLSTFLYFEQAHIVRDAFDDPAKRTALFATLDLAVNVLTIGTQLFLTGRVVAAVGLPAALALVPALVFVGFAGLGLFPTLVVLAAFQVVRRAGNFAIARPAREMLFTVVPREEKYKSKNFIDTVVYRGGDAVSGWLFAGLSAIGLGLSAISFLAVPLAAGWAVTGLLLGKRNERIS